MYETAWNTGNPYTRHGQRIGAVSDGVIVWFVDIDRSVEGQYADTIDSQRRLKESVTAHYLRSDGYSFPRDIYTSPEIKRCHEMAESLGPAPNEQGGQGTSIRKP